MVLAPTGRLATTAAAAAAAGAATTTPFKGDAFPAYVLQRTIARPPAPSATPTTGLVTAPMPLVAALNLGSDSNGANDSIALDRVRQLGPTLTRPTASTAGPTNAALVVPSLPPTPQRPHPLAGATSRPRQRPSLSEQLKSISQGAEAITTQLRAAHDLSSSTPTTVAGRTASGRTNAMQGSSGTGGLGDNVHFLLEATTIHLAVGRLECRFPCPVQFAADRCTYLFQHPFEPKEVHMVMYYRDMEQLQISTRDRSLRFRIAHSLEQFGEDYRPSNPQHHLRIVFATVSEAQRVKAFFAKIPCRGRLVRGTWSMGLDVDDGS